MIHASSCFSSLASGIPSVPSAGGADVLEGPPAVASLPSCIGDAGSESPVVGLPVSGVDANELNGASVAVAAAWHDGLPVRMSSTDPAPLLHAVTPRYRGCTRSWSTTRWYPAGPRNAVGSVKGSDAVVKGDNDACVAGSGHSSTRNGGPRPRPRPRTRVGFDVPSSISEP